MRAVILADKGVQDEEMYPLNRLKEARFEVDVASITSGQFHGKYGIPFHANKTTSEIREEDYDLAIVPGGWGSPEIIRQCPHALKFLQDMNKESKVIAAICHGPWVLISAKIVKERKMTCYKGMKDDLENAGAIYVDENVVVDGNIITAPHYRNNPEWMRETLNHWESWKVRKDKTEVAFFNCIIKAGDGGLEKGGDVNIGM